MIDLCVLNIQKAKSGDRDAAMQLLREFCCTVANNRDNQGRPTTRCMGTETHNHTLFDEKLLDYLRECFSKVLEGKENDGHRITADVALNLAHKGTRGRKAKPRTRDRQLLGRVLISS